MRDRPCFQAGGTLKPEAIYIDRPADEALPAALLRGEYCNILAPRQVGKTSLAQRARKRLWARGYRSALVDLTRLGTYGVSAEDWFYSFLDVVVQELELAGDSWAAHTGRTHPERLRRCLLDLVQGAEHKPLVIFVDEIDSLFKLRFADDFFALVRSIFNDGDGAKGRLLFCLIGVAVPLDLVADPRTTPYNIGTAIRLEDFRWEEIQPFALGLTGLSAAPEETLRSVYRWTNGHPALTQYLCHLLVSRGLAPGEQAPQVVDQLVRKHLLQPPPNESRVLLHIENFFQRTNSSSTQSFHDEQFIPAPYKARMLSLYRRLLAQESTPVEPTNGVHIALRRLGLVADEARAGVCYLKIRNSVFTEVFNDAWVRRHEENNAFWAELERWRAGGKRKQDLLSKRKLLAFERWVKHQDDLTTEEKEFLLTSMDEEQRKSRRGVWIASLSAGLAGLLSILLAFMVLVLVGRLRNEKVIDLKRLLQQISTPYERMVEFPYFRPQVGARAQQIGADLLKVSDPKISLVYRIVKYQYASYAYVMAASAQSFEDGDPAAVVRLADQALSAGEQGLFLLQAAQVSPRQEEREAYRWTIDDDGHNRMRLLRAMALALKGKASGIAALREEALGTLGQIEPRYLACNDPRKTRELRWACPELAPPAACVPQGACKRNLPK